MDNAKPWYLSKGVLGPVLAIAGMAGTAFGVDVGAGEQVAIVDQTIAAVGAVTTLIGTLLGLYGRIVATSRIK